MKQFAVVAVVALAGCATTVGPSGCDSACDETVRAEGRPVPTHRAQPVYPLPAAQNGIGGCVVVSFVITPAGIADQYQVLDSKPAGVFDSATLKALNDWRFEVPARPGRYAQEISYKVTPRQKNPQPGCIKTPGYDELNKAGAK